MKQEKQLVFAVLFITCTILFVSRLVVIENPALLELGLAASVFIIVGILYSFYKAILK